MADNNEELIEVAKEALNLNKEFLNVMVGQNIKLTNIFIEHYEKEIEFKTKCIADWEEQEPPKFFKKIHAEWQEKIDSLKKEIEDAHKKLYEERCQLGESLSLFNENNA